MFSLDQTNVVQRVAMPEERQEGIGGGEGEEGKGEGGRREGKFAQYPPFWFQNLSSGRAKYPQLVQ